MQQLLLDQQHQIDLLLRGNFSLRGSMNGMRRSSREIESQNKRLLEELDQQHKAAIECVPAPSSHTEQQQNLEPLTVAFPSPTVLRFS